MLTINLITPFGISGLLITITCFSLFLICLIYGKSRLHQTWALFNLAVTFWGIGNFIVGTTSSPKIAIWGWKIAYAGAVFLPAVFYHVAHVLSGTNKQGLLITSYLLSLTFSTLSLFTNLLFPQSWFQFKSLYYTTPTITFYACHLNWLILSIIAHYKLYKHSQKAVGKERKDCLFLLFATMVGFIGGYCANLVFFGIPIYPYSNYLIPIYFLIVTYAIFNFQFLSINVIIKRSLIYTILISTISVLYFTIIFLIEWAFKDYAGYSSIIVSLLVATIIATAFIPFKNFIEKIVEKIFFKGSLEEIAEENVMLRKEVADKEKMKAVASLASGLAHEIRNPLTAIKTFIEYYPKKKNDPDFETKFNTIVGKEIHRIDDLINNLLQFAKPSPLSLKETKIIPVIESSLDLLSSQLKTKNIQVHKDYQSDPIHKIDENKMKQVFLNLFLNAIEAMEDGGTITIAVRNQRSEKPTDHRSQISDH